MRFFKIIFKLVLIVLVIFSFLYDFGFINLDSGFKFALPTKGKVPSLDPTTITSVTYQNLPFKNVEIYTIRTTAGNHIIYGLSDVQKVELGALIATSLTPVHQYTGANALFYIAVLFGLFMIPTKKIQKIKRIKNSRR